YIVTKPCRRRIIGIEGLKRYPLHFAGDTVDHQPPASLPAPAWRVAILLERVVETIHSLHHEGPIGNVVRCPDRKLLRPAINKQRSDLQIDGPALVFADEPLDDRPL